jgi:hypothetical protein
MSAVYHPYPCVHCSGREIASHPLFITPYVRCLSPLIKLAVHQPYVRCLPPLPMCPQFRKGDCQPFTLQKLTTGYKPITSSLQAAGLVTPQQACYKGLVILYELASFVTKLVTKLVSHYEYLSRNEARYEARNASVYAQAQMWVWQSQIWSRGLAHVAPSTASTQPTCPSAAPSSR